MPRYHFHVFDGADFVDAEGTQLRSWREAQEHAVRTAGHILADRYKSFRLGEDWRMEVTDASGLTLFAIHFFLSMSAAIGSTVAREAIAVPNSERELEP